MASLAPKLAAGALAAALMLGGAGASRLLVDEPTSAPLTEMGCEDWGVQLTQGECFAASAIRYVSLYNLQGAAQFCKWRPANPGEWNRINAYASSGIPPQQIVTWFGASIKNQIEAYFATGAPPFAITANTAPNKCKTPIPAPVVQSVTPGQTDVTVTLED